MQTEFKRLRKRSGLTQVEFAKKFQIPLRTVQTWEQGRSVPVPYITYMIETILDYEDKMEGTK